MEEKEVMHELINPEDFTVEVKGLPNKNLGVLEMKALLWLHLEKVTEQEDNCIKELKLSKDKSTVYQINFGMRDYSKMKRLISIYKDTKVLVLEENRLEKDMASEKPAKKRLNKIAKLNTKIEGKIKKHNDAPESDSEEVVNAYVTFKSMEGRERAIRAYQEESWLRWLRIKFNCKRPDYSKKL